MSRPLVDLADEITAVSQAAQPSLLALVSRWLPGGKLIGATWVTGSFRPADMLYRERPGNCRVCVESGLWLDIASGDRGCGAVSLAAAIFDIPEACAARRLVELIGADTLGLQGRLPGLFPAGEPSL